MTNDRIDAGDYDETRVRIHDIDENNGFKDENKFR